jgi:hypothetical protein
MRFGRDPGCCAGVGNVPRTVDVGVGAAVPLLPLVQEGVLLADLAAGKSRRQDFSPTTTSPPGNFVARISRRRRPRRQEISSPGFLDDDDLAARKFRRQDFSTTPTSPPGFLADADLATRKSRCREILADADLATRKSRRQDFSTTPTSPPGNLAAENSSPTPTSPPGNLAAENFSPTPTSPPGNLAAENFSSPRFLADLATRKFEPQ